MGSSSWTTRAIRRLVNMKHRFVDVLFMGGIVELENLV